MQTIKHTRAINWTQIVITHRGPGPLFGEQLVVVKLILFVILLKLHVF